MSSLDPCLRAKVVSYLDALVNVRYGLHCEWHSMDVCNVPTPMLYVHMGLQARGQTVALVKSDRDNRYSASEITTHDGISRACHAVPALADVRAAVGQAYAATQVIAIDEAQFFPDLLQFCSHAADHEGKQILVAGLDGDFRRAPFGQVGSDEA